MHGESLKEKLIAIVESVVVEDLKSDKFEEDFESSKNGDENNENLSLTQTSDTNLKETSEETLDENFEPAKLEEPADILLEEKTEEEKFSEILEKFQSFDELTSESTSTIETTSEFETTTSATESTITVTEVRIGPCNPDPCQNEGKCSETGSKERLYFFMRNT